ncbi:MAG: VWA domain-containing protein [Bacteroidales bacterium]|nr:VWA domain-containing protein [Bacteroidales bacterium]
MHNISFSYPIFLWLLILIVPLMIFIIKKEKQRFAYIKYSDVSQFSNKKKTWRIYLRNITDYLRIAVVVILCFAASRPHFSLSKDDKSIEGIDLVLTLDVSPSMLAEDFKPNRLESAKNVAREFIQNRKNDEIGLVVFSGEAFTQCPPTIDHDVLLSLLKETKSGELQDGTAIGDGLTTAVNRIRTSKAKSKVIILITDGVNNSGQVDPLQAASFAKQYGIRVYTIGVGTQGLAPFPVQTPIGKRYEQMKVEIDETLLQNIASSTGAKYFRSTKNSSLEKIFKEIDAMEKSIINVSLYNQTKDVGFKFALVALVLLIVECVLNYCVIRRNY